MLDTAVRTVQLGQKVKGSHAEHVRLLPSLPERVEVVRRIFNWYAGPSSLGFKAIADRLNRESVVSPKQRGWSLSSIRAMIVDTVHVGHVVWNRRAMGKFHRIADRREVEQDGCGKRSLDWNAHEDWLVCENAHEPLIERELFDRAQRVMKERGARRCATGLLIGKAKASPYLLSGLLRCGACGGSMHGRAVWKSKRRKDGSRVGTFYYVCSAAIAKGKSICEPINFLRGTLDEFVMDVVTQRITALLGENGRSTLLRIVEKELATEAHDPGPEIRRLGARLDEITAKIDSVIDLAAASPEHKDLMQERLGRLRSERREIEDRLLEIDPPRAWPVG